MTPELGAFRPSSFGEKTTPARGAAMQGVTRMEMEPDGRFRLRISLIIGLMLLLVAAPVVLNDTTNIWWICMNPITEDGKYLSGPAHDLKGISENERDRVNPNLRDQGAVEKE
jgi:hypothetical protein